MRKKEKEIRDCDVMFVGLLVDSLLVVLLLFLLVFDREQHTGRYRGGRARKKTERERKTRHERESCGERRQDSTP